MSTTITKLTQTDEAFHPALGYRYLVELSNGERFKIYLDTLLDNYKMKSGSSIATFVKSLIGKEWIEE